MIYKQQKGFSLIETMVSLVAFSIILLVSGQLLISTQRISSNTNSQTELRQESAKINNLITYELRKAIYFYPKPNPSVTTSPTPIYIPLEVRNNSDALRISSSNLPTYDSSYTTQPPPGNVVTFISVDRTSNVSDIKNLDQSIFKKNKAQATITPSLELLVDNTINNSTTLLGFNIIDQISKNAKVQLLTLNCLFLRKNVEKNNIELVLYQQKGFFNDSRDGHLSRLNNQVLAKGPLLTPNIITLMQTTELIKDKVVDQIRYYLDNKNYTGIEVPNSPFINSDSAYTPPSLDFTNGGSNINWAKNSKYILIASNVGVKKSNSSLTYFGNQPTDSNLPSTYYKTAIDFKNNPLNSSIINNSLNNEDIGFKVVYNKSTNIGTVNISVDLAKLSSDQRKAFYNHDEYEINPKISSK